MRFHSPRAPTAPLLHAENASTPAAVPSVAVVVVHGMGEQREGETLLEWAEPILGRIDWALSHDPRARAGLRPGVRVTSSTLGIGSSARVDAELHTASDDPGTDNADSVEPGTDNPDSVDPGNDEGTVAVTFLEATWSRSFVPVSRTETFRWGARFLWRALWRLFCQLRRTAVWVPLFALRTKKPWVPTVRDLFAAVLGMLFAVLAFVLVLVVGTVGSVFLTLAAPLLLIPGIKLVLQPVLDTLVSYVGDVATYKRHPLRAAAMEGVIIKRITEAHALLEDAPGSQLIVIAHSQGSAIALTALLGGSLGTQHWNTRVRLNTVGTAVSLITTSSFLEGRADVGFTPVARWASGYPEITWNNYWGIWDPVPSGPMGDNNAHRDKRWRESYTREATDALGPGEHPVHNTSSPFTDHQTYARNILQVIDPIVTQISPAAGDLVADRISRGAQARTVAVRRTRPLVWVMAVVISLGLVQWWMPGWATEIELHPLRIAPAVVAVLLVLVLVWVYSWRSTSVERALVWPKSAAHPTVLAIAIPLLAYALGALVALTFLLAPVLGNWTWLAAAVFVPLGLLLVVSVFAAPPRPLPERRTAGGQPPT
ncbi:hypothetical protein B0I08_101664 [Glaciihabitans tibetensis]|uniref:Uncharacterized protein n=1 Tax=Glaciihabitans tibetensis TaxID=1266600 RepID=A0A2T0VJZ0_9MICO|nr:hypothetical protein [Glaciihabitans tibetensis]PRY70528.1 hypothetical protein B0I08_101664 [Glaciihabitans tibetensis]